MRLFLHSTIWLNLRIGQHNKTINRDDDIVDAKTDLSVANCQQPQTIRSKYTSIVLNGLVFHICKLNL